MDQPYPIVFPFHAMAQSGNLIGLKMLLGQVGPDHAVNIVNHRDHRGLTVLHCAIQTGKIDVIRLLLDLGADIHAEVTGPDPEGWTALHFAAFDGHPDIIELLVQRGAQIEHHGKCMNGATALRVAVIRNQSQCVEKLLQLGADPLEVNTDGFCLRHEAANVRSETIVEILRSAGCDPNAQAKDGSTPIMWAMQHNSRRLLESLKTYGGDR